MATQAERKRCPIPGGNLSIPTPNSRIAFCVSPICPTMHSTDSAGMKQPSGAKSPRSCLRSMHWSAANHRREGAIFVSATGQGCPRATTAEVCEADYASAPSTQSSARGNTVHFSTLMAFSMLIGGSELCVRRRSGKLLIFRLTPRGFRRLRLEPTRSCRISSSTAS